MILRPYQQDLVHRVSQAFRRGRAGVMQMATGGGKTACAATIIERAVAKGRRVVFAAHLDTLVGDTYARIVKAGVHAGYVQAGRPSDPTAPTQVASLATLYSRGERPPADLIIVDECHRAPSASPREILESYGKAWILGLTATPQRGDGQPLGEIFDWMECGPTVRELIAQGYLVPADVLAPIVPVDALVTEPVEAYLAHCKGRRAIVFAANVNHAEWIAYGLTARGVPAAVITGETPRAEREAARTMLVEGGLSALVSVNVFVEGWDCPSVDAVILAREFSVVGSFLQAIGRGLRPAPGKTDCVVVDLRGSVNLHGLPDEDRAWSLTGKPKRTEALAALRRCLKCAAIFRPARTCPRCGAVSDAKAEGAKLPRILDRDEKLERLSHLSQEDRDRRYLMSLVNVAINRMRMPEHRAEQWALRTFERKFGRAYGQHAA